MIIFTCYNLNILKNGRIYQLNWYSKYIFTNVDIKLLWIFIKKSNDIREIIFHITVILLKQYIKELVVEIKEEQILKLRKLSTISRNLSVCYKCLNVCTINKRSLP